MPYSGPYSLGTRCATEVLSTALALYLGTSAVANALLPGAKGQGMGYGWISFAYGFAFFFSGLLFGAVSAFSNPALTLANVIMGEIGAADFFALSACQFLGAFLGACCTWMHWLPHFKTVPEPPALTAGDALLRKRDTITKDAVQIASYNTEPSKQVGERNNGAMSWWHDVAYYAGTNNKYRGPRRKKHHKGTAGEHQTLVVPEDGEGVRNGSSTGPVAFNVSQDPSGRDTHPRIAWSLLPPRDDDHHAGDMATPEGSVMGDPQEYSQHELQNRFMEEDLARQAALMQGPDTHVETSPDSAASLPTVDTVAAVAGTEGGGLGGVGSGGSAPPLSSVRIDLESVTLGERRPPGGGMSVPPGPPAFRTGGSVPPSGGASVPPPPQQYPYTYMPDVRAPMEMSGGEDMPRPQARRPPPPHVNFEEPGPVDSGGMGARARGLGGALLGRAPGGSVSGGALDEMAFQRVSPTPAQLRGLSYSDVKSGIAHTDRGSHGDLSRMSRGGVGTERVTPQRSSASFGGVRVMRPTGLSSSFTSRHHLHPSGAALKKGKGLVPAKKKVTVMEVERARLVKLYEAAIIADQNVKLSVFATRPAVYSPPFNLVCEFLCTVVLLTGILLVNEQSVRLSTEAAQVYSVLAPFYNGLYIVVANLGLGGPTGLSANPARDLGPRIAHWILPIPNKGPSEWHYGWIPFLADFAGGAAAGGFYILIRNLQFNILPH